MSLVLPSRKADSLTVQGLRTPPRGAGPLYGGASLLANLLGYLFLVVLSRTLEPAEFGAAGALLGFGIIASILSVALQLVVARAIAANPSGRTTLSARSALWLAAGTTMVAWGCTPAAVHYLHLSSPWPSLWVGATLFPMTVGGALLGHLLGRQRFIRLAIGTVLVASARLLSGIVTWVAGWGLTGALAALAVATMIATLVLAWLADVPQWWGQTGSTWRRDIVDVARAADRVAAFLVLTNLDILLARHFLTAHDSGIYALASLFAKAGLWGPQFFAVVVFPRIAAGHARTRLFWRAALATAGFGGVLIAGTALLAEPVIVAVSGEKYLPAAAYAPWFALLGTAFALVNLSLVTSVALNERLFGLATWLAAATELTVISGWRHDSIVQVLSSCIVVAGLMAVVGAVLAMRPRRTVAATELVATMGS